MVIRYRTEDLTRWGTGVGVDLQAVWIDENFWDLVSRVQELEAAPPPAAAISHFIVEGDQWTIVFEDYSTIGPYTLPTVPLVFRGDWADATAYNVNEMFQNGGTIYVVLVAHTSVAPFDPGRQISGQDVYGFGLQVDGVLPSGGAAGMWLQKSSATDFDATWATNPFPTGGLDGQYLTKGSDDDFDASWTDLPVTVVTISGADDVAEGDPEEGSILRWRSGEYVKEQDAPPLLAINSTLLLSIDNLHRLNLFTAPAGCVITIPLEADWSADTLFVGQAYHFRQLGGPLTFTPVSGVTLRGIQGFDNGTDVQGAVVTLYYTSTDTWDLYGLLAISGS